MDKSDRRLPSTRHSAPSLRGQEDPSPIPTQRLASVPASGVVGVVGNAVITRTQQSSASTVSAASSEVTPISASSRKSTPEGIPGNVSITANRAFIDAAVLADSGVDYDDAVEYNYFGDMPSPNPKDHSPRYISGELAAILSLYRGTAIWGGYIISHTTTTLIVPSQAAATVNTAFNNATITTSTINEMNRINNTVHLNSKEEDVGNAVGTPVVLDKSAYDSNTEAGITMMNHHRTYYQLFLNHHLSEIG